MLFERSGKRSVGILDAHIENGKLVIDTVKPEGKREMTYEEFLRSAPSRLILKPHPLLQRRTCFAQYTNV